MKIHLIRHGRTDWNDLNHIQGKNDIPLNLTGIAQAEALGNTLKQQNLQVSHIYTSFLLRAKQTAEIISNILNVPCDILDGLEEVNLGDWEGLSWDEVKQLFPRRYEAFLHNRRYTKASGGESYEDMLMRLLPALKKLAATCDRDVIVVTHSGVIMPLLCYLNNTPFEEMRTYKVKNTSVTTIDGENFI